MGGGLPGPTTAGSWAQATDTPPEGSQTHACPGQPTSAVRAGKASDLWPSPFLYRADRQGERGSNLPKAHSKPMARRGDWAPSEVFFHYSTS